MDMRRAPRPTPLPLCRGGTRPIERCADPTGCPVTRTSCAGIESRAAETDAARHGRDVTATGLQRGPFYLVDTQAGRQQRFNQRLFRGLRRAPIGHFHPALPIQLQTVGARGAAALLARKDRVEGDARMFRQILTPTPILLLVNAFC